LNVKVVKSFDAVTRAQSRRVIMGAKLRPTPRNVKVPAPSQKRIEPIIP
jgi:hypothetical protein